MKSSHTLFAIASRTSRVSCYSNHNIRVAHRFYSSSRNRVIPSIRNPDQFHHNLQACSANKTLLLTLWTTSSCTTCHRTILPLISSHVTSRASKPSDHPSFRGGIAFAEVELDSSEDVSGMMGLGVEYGVNSVPTLMAMGGRRAERLTDRVTKESDMAREAWVEEWVDKVMEKGDPYAVDEGSGGSGGGWFSKILGN